MTAASEEIPTTKAERAGELKECSGQDDMHRLSTN
jgi:hypothetical protein